MSVDEGFSKDQEKRLRRISKRRETTRELREKKDQNNQEDRITGEYIT